MKWISKTFDELNGLELYKILQLRNEVFVVEQDVVYQDADDKDQKAIHLFLKDIDKIVAYVRIFNAGDYFENPSIGRVVVHPQYRRKNFGKEVMEKAIRYVLINFENKKIEISAQTYLKKFYNNLGFKEEGEIYLEDTLPHFRMIRK